MTGPTWTILVPTLGQRRELLRRLLDGLMPQVDRHAGRVDVLSYWDNGEASLADKKQALLDAATGDYVSFVDDDDTVTDDYVSSILAALDDRPDFVGFMLEVHINGAHHRMSHHSLRWDGWGEAADYYTRDITCANPMLTSVARTARFDTARGLAEDVPWVTQLRAGGLLRTEVFVDRTLYHYWWVPDASVWRRPGDRIRATTPAGFPWQPPPVSSPQFAWHPDSPLPAQAPTADMLIIVPARTRHWNIRRMLDAWSDTDAWGTADLRIDIDLNDPELKGYRAIDLPSGARYATWNRWKPCMHKLDKAARQEAGSYFALGFMGDDHVPRTRGWAQRWVEVLREMRTGIVYGDDALRGEELPTQWATTSDIVRALGRLCPSPVEHLWSDTAVLDLGRAADCIRYLPDTVVEHMHYVAGKAVKDEQYARVNGRSQWRRDEIAYLRWRDGGGLAADAATVRALRP